MKYNYCWAFIAVVWRHVVLVAPKFGTTGKCKSWLIYGVISQYLQTGQEGFLLSYRTELEVEEFCAVVVDARYYRTIADGRCCIIQILRLWKNPPAL